MQGSPLLGSGGLKGRSLRGPPLAWYDPLMTSAPTPEYVAVLRRLTGAKKLHAASELYWFARRLKAAAVRQQHPDWTEEQVLNEVKEIFLRATT